MASQRVTFNPYNYCQNNPINRTDPTGALDNGQLSDQSQVTNVDSEPYNKKYVGLKFAGQDEADLYEEYKKVIKTKIDNIDTEISGINNEIGLLGADQTKKKSRLQNKIGKLQIKKGYMQNIQVELSNIENQTDTIFRIRLDENVSDKSGGGNIRYNFGEHEIDINIMETGDFSKIQKIAHELKHADQYLNRQIAFTYTGKPYSPTYDYMDEKEAFDRANLFYDDTKEQSLELSDDEIDMEITARYGLYRSNRRKTIDSFIRANPDLYKDEIITFNRIFSDNYDKAKIIYKGWKKEL